MNAARTNTTWHWEQREDYQEFLVALGVSASRIETLSYGEERPLDRSNSEQAWAKNRRAHFVMTI